MERQKPESVPEVEENTEASDGLFELVSRAPAPRPVEGIVIGTLSARAESGEALVDFPGNPGSGPLPARSLVSFGDEDLGRAVALMFEGGRASAPILLGLIQGAERPAAVEARVDRERVVIEAQSEIELRCGESSIVLTRDGKICIRGRDVLSRASAGNRIKGGSVRIN